MSGASETVRIPPHPKILRVLAEIDFDHWQCIAELIDNGFDEFLDIERDHPDWEEPLRVNISLPSAAGQTILVSDNGRGMSLDRITQAARAGYSANDPLTKLGLFGVGFNVATARLGSVTTFLSTEAGSSEWAGVRIDVRTIGEDYAVPVVRVPKSNHSEHGTRIEIAELSPLASHYFQPANRTRLRRRLGAIYSYLLNERRYGLSVDQVRVAPYRHCVWSEGRSVTRGGERIPARIDIDDTLVPMSVCYQCGSWQDVDNTKCEQCESSELVRRERRIHGWLGIARQLDTKEFGIDFLRNGRKILRFDRSLFEWADPDDASAATLVEYPLEVPYASGRIVGEIHLDHVRVSYTKDSFDTGSRGWRTAVRVIRGDTSLLPRTARSRGDAPNDSPLARLHRGFRRNDPGVNYLTAGDGITRRDTSEWVKKFHEGVSAFQSDEEWWAAAKEHDRLKMQIREEKERRQRSADEADKDERDDPSSEFFSGSGSTETPDGASEADAPAAPRTEQERIDLWLSVGRSLPNLSAEYTAKGVGTQPVKLDVYAVRGHPVVTDAGERVPVHMASRPKGAFAAFVDLDHALFANFDDDPEDIVLMALAQQLVVRARTAVPLAAVYADLKSRYLSGRAIRTGSLQAEASQLLTGIQQRMAPLVGGDPTRPWHRALADHERALAKQRIVETLRIATLDAILKSGDYLTYVPAAAVPRIVAEWPEAFLDQHLFARPFATLEAASQQQALARVIGYLTDAAWLASSPVAADRDELVRARLSLKLLPDELVAESES